MWRRVVDVLLALLILAAALEGLWEATQRLREAGLSGLPGLVAVGQVIMGAGGFATVFALWRRPRLAARASIVWALGGLLAGTVATFAWSPFNLSAFLSAAISVILIGGAAYWWLSWRHGGGRAVNVSTTS